MGYVVNIKYFCCFKEIFLEIGEQRKTPDGRIILVVSEAQRDLILAWEEKKARDEQKPEF